MAYLLTSLLLLKIILLVCSVKEAILSTPESSDASDADVADLFDQLLEKYDKAIRPNYTGDPTIVNVDMSVLSFGRINEVEMTFVVDLFFRQMWYDYRLRHNLTHSLIPLLGRQSPPDLIWTPDSVFINAKKTTKHSVTLNNDKLDIFQDGRVFWGTRVTVEANCHLDLRRYPMDTQTCSIGIESYGYPKHHVNYQWYKKALVVISPELSQYTLVGYGNETILRQYHVGLYVVLQGSFTFERRIAVSILQIFFPCIAIVCVSWVSLWFHINCTSARVGIGITTLLTISTIWFSVNRRLPRVSYVKAIDIYFLTSFSFILLTLIEYTVVVYGTFTNWKDSYSSRIEKKRRKENQSSLGSFSSRSLFKWSYMKSIKKNYTQSHINDNKGDNKSVVGENVKMKHLDNRGKMVEYSYVQEQKGPRTDRPKRGLTKGNKLKKDIGPYYSKPFPVTGKPASLDIISRFLFPFFYLSFNVSFWFYYHRKHSNDEVHIDF